MNDCTCFGLVRRAMVLLGLGIGVVSPALSNPYSTTKKLELPDDVRAALKALPDAEVAAATENGIPTFVRGNFGQVTVRPGQKPQARDLEPLLPRIAPIFRLGPSDLHARREKVDSAGLTHIEFDQTKSGLPVVGTR